MRVPKVGSSRARVRAWGSFEIAMTASAPGQFTAARAARILGTMPPLMTPSAIRRSASSAVIVASFSPAASRMPSTSVIRTSWRAPSPAAIPAAASSALTLQTMPCSSRARGATTATCPATSSESRKSRRSPTTWATSPSPGTRSPIMKPPSTPDSPTASTPRSRRSETSSEFTTPRRTAAATSRAAWSVTRSPPSNLLGTPEPLQPLGDALAAAVDQHRRPLTGDRGHFVEDVGLVGQRRAAELEDEDFAHVVYSAFSMTYSSVRSQPKASPDAVAQTQVQADEDFGRIHGGAHRVAVEVHRLAGEDDRPGDGDAQLPELQHRPAAGPWHGLRVVQAGRLELFLVGQAGVAGGSGHAAPVGVAAVDRGLEEAAADDGPGHGARVVVILGAADLAGDQGRGPFAVGGLLPGERPRHRLDGAAQRGRRRGPGLHRRRARRARSEQEDRVVGAGVAVDTELVPGPLDDGGEQPVQSVGRDPGVGQDHAQHRRHARMDHAHALGDAGHSDPDCLAVRSGQIDDGRGSFGPGVRGHHGLAPRPPGTPRRRPAAAPARRPRPGPCQRAGASRSGRWRGPACRRARSTGRPILPRRRPAGRPRPRPLLRRWRSLPWRRWPAPSRNGRRCPARLRPGARARR